MTAPDRPGTPPGQRPGTAHAASGASPAGEVHVRPMEYLVSAWPEGHECPAAQRWCLLVTDRGHGRWAVEQERFRGRKMVLHRSGLWRLDSPGDLECRFSLEEALALARAHAACVEIAGRTAADVISEHTGKGCRR